MGVAELYERASPASQRLVRDILEQDEADDAVTAQVGSALSQGDTARLLDKTVQAVSKDPRLLRVVGRNGRPVYPVVQFDGRRQVAGVADVVALLDAVLEPLTVCLWLTGDNPQLDGQRPIDRLRAGDLVAVLAVAGQLAASAA